MSKQTSALKRAFKAASETMEPQRYGPNSKAFICGLCATTDLRMGWPPL